MIENDDRNSVNDTASEPELIMEEEVREQEARELQTLASDVMPGDVADDEQVDTQRERDLAVINQAILDGNITANILLGLDINNVNNLKFRYSDLFERTRARFEAYGVLFNASIFTQQYYLFESRSDSLTFGSDVVKAQYQELKKIDIKKMDIDDLTKRLSAVMLRQFKIQFANTRLDMLEKGTDDDKEREAEEYFQKHPEQRDYALYDLERYQVVVLGDHLEFNEKTYPDDKLEVFVSDMANLAETLGKAHVQVSIMSSRLSAAAMNGFNNAYRYVRNIKNDNSEADLGMSSVRLSSGEVCGFMLRSLVDMRGQVRLNLAEHDYQKYLDQITNRLFSLDLRKEYDVIDDAFDKFNIWIHDNNIPYLSVCTHVLADVLKSKYKPGYAFGYEFSNFALYPDINVPSVFLSQNVLAMSIQSAINEKSLAAKQQKIKEAFKVYQRAFVKFYCEFMVSCLSELPGFVNENTQLRQEVCDAVVACMNYFNSLSSAAEEDGDKVAAQMYHDCVASCLSELPHYIDNNTEVTQEVCDTIMNYIKHFISLGIAAAKKGERAKAECYFRAASACRIDVNNRRSIVAASMLAEHYLNILQMPQDDELNDVKRYLKWETVEISFMHHQLYDQLLTDIGKRFAECNYYGNFLESSCSDNLRNKPYYNKLYSADGKFSDFEVLRTYAQLPQEFRYDYLFENDNLYLKASGGSATEASAAYEAELAKEGGEVSRAHPDACRSLTTSYFKQPLENLLINSVPADADKADKKELWLLSYVFNAISIVLNAARLWDSHMPPANVTAEQFDTFYFQMKRLNCFIEQLEECNMPVMAGIISNFQQLFRKLKDINLLVDLYRQAVGREIELDFVKTVSRQNKTLKEFYEINSVKEVDLVLERVVADHYIDIFRRIMNTNDNDEVRDLIADLYERRDLPQALTVLMMLSRINPAKCRPGDYFKSLQRFDRGLVIASYVVANIFEFLIGNNQEMAVILSEYLTEIDLINAMESVKTKLKNKRKAVMYSNVDRELLQHDIEKRCADLVMFAAETNDYFVDAVDLYERMSDVTQRHNMLCRICDAEVDLDDQDRFIALKRVQDCFLDREISYIKAGKVNAEDRIALFARLDNGHKEMFIESLQNRDCWTEKTADGRSLQLLLKEHNWQQRLAQAFVVPEQANEELGARGRVRIRWQSQNDDYVLSDEIYQALFTPEGALHQAPPERSKNRHLVLQAGDLEFRFWPDMPAYPLYSLSQLITGLEMPQSTYVLITILPEHGDAMPHHLVVEVMPHIEGDKLTRYFPLTEAEAPIGELNLDKVGLTNNYITGLGCNFEDQHNSNFLVTRDGVLVPIDYEHGGHDVKSDVPQLMNFIYFLDFMRQPASQVLDQDVINTFLDLDIEKTLLTWLEMCEAESRRYQRIFGDYYNQLTPQNIQEPKHRFLTRLLARRNSDEETVNPLDRGASSNRSILGMAIGGLVPLSSKRLRAMQDYFGNINQEYEPADLLKPVNGESYHARWLRGYKDSSNPCKRFDFLHRDMVRKFTTKAYRQITQDNDEDGVQAGVNRVTDTLTHVSSTISTLTGEVYLHRTAYGPRTVGDLEVMSRPQSPRRSKSRGQARPGADIDRNSAATVHDYQQIFIGEHAMSPQRALVAQRQLIEAADASLVHASLDEIYRQFYKNDFSSLRTLELDRATALLNKIHQAKESPYSTLSLPLSARRRLWDMYLRYLTVRSLSLSYYIDVFKGDKDKERFAELKTYLATHTELLQSLDLNGFGLWLNIYAQSPMPLLSRLYLADNPLVLSMGGVQVASTGYSDAVRASATGLQQGFQARADYLYELQRLVKVSRDKLDLINRYVDLLRRLEAVSRELKPLLDVIDLFQRNLAEKKQTYGESVSEKADINMHEELVRSRQDDCDLVQQRYDAIAAEMCALRDESAYGDILHKVDAEYKKHGFTAVDRLVDVSQKSHQKCSHKYQRCSKQIPELVLSGSQWFVYDLVKLLNNVDVRIHVKDDNLRNRLLHEIAVRGDRYGDFLGKRRLFAGMKHYQQYSHESAAHNLRFFLTEPDFGKDLTEVTLAGYTSIELLELLQRNIDTEKQQLKLQTINFNYGGLRQQGFQDKRMASAFVRNVRQDGLIFTMALSDAYLFLTPGKKQISHLRLYERGRTNARECKNILDPNSQSDYLIEPAFIVELSDSSVLILAQDGAKTKFVRWRYASDEVMISDSEVLPPLRIIAVQNSRVVILHKDVENNSDDAVMLCVWDCKNSNEIKLLKKLSTSYKYGIWLSVLSSFGADYQDIVKCLMSGEGRVNGLVRTASGLVTDRPSTDRYYTAGVLRHPRSMALDKLDLTGVHLVCDQRQMATKVNAPYNKLIEQLLICCTDINYETANIVGDEWQVWPRLDAAILILESCGAKISRVDNVMNAIDNRAAPTNTDHYTPLFFTPRENVIEQPSSDAAVISDPDMGDAGEDASDYEAGVGNTSSSTDSSSENPVSDNDDDHSDRELPTP